MAVYDTGWVYVADNAETQVMMPAGRITQVRVRWKGVSKNVTESSTTSNSTSGTVSGGGASGIKSLSIPDKSGWNYVSTYVSASISLGGSAAWQVSAQIPGRSWKTNSGTGTGGSINDTGTQGAPYYCYGEYDGGVGYNWSLYGRNSWTRTVAYQTENPQITVGGNVTAHSGTLNGGVESAWYDCTTGFVAGANTVRHDSGGSGLAYVQIEVTYVPTLTPRQLLPEQFGRETRESLRHYADIVQPEGNQATAWHLRLVIGTDPALVTPEYELDTALDQTGFEVSGESGWEALSSDGAPVGSVIRYTPPTPEDMPMGRWYWQILVWDDDTEQWSAGSSIWQFRLVLSVAARVALEISGQDYSASSRAIRVSETTNGELGSMQFELYVPHAVTVPPAGAVVALAVRDATGLEDQFSGWLVGEPARQGPQIYRCVCKLPDSILAERYVREDYASQDVGQTLADIVDEYCYPLSSAGINTSTGYSRPIAAYGKTALDIFIEVREQYGLLFWVRSVDGVVFLVAPDDLGAALLGVVRGQVAI